MRRVNDISIQFEDRPGAPRPRSAARAGKAAPKGGRPGARPLMRSRWPLLLKSKKGQRVLLVAAVIGGLTAIPAWLASSSGALVIEHARTNLVAFSARAGFRVQEILVEGRNRTPRDQLLGALAVQRGDPIFGIDLSATRQRLEEISWVKTATIERRLPGEVHLLITERAPVVLWQNQGHYYLVDREGQVVGDEIDEYSGLPLVVGEGAPDHAAELLDLLQTEPELQKRVKAAQWVGERRWNLTLDKTSGGLEIRLPEDDPVAAWHELAKLDREQSLLERQLSVIDMRLPDRLVLRTQGAAQDKTASAHSKRKSQPGKDA